MSRYLIIDGYNAINRIRFFSTKIDASLDAARMYFIKVVKDFMREKQIFDKIIIVFDSKQKAIGVRRHSYGNVDVYFTSYDKDADSVIIDIIRDSLSSDKITVSSDDNFVRNHAKGFGRDVISTKRLEEIIMLRKKISGTKIEKKVLERDRIEEINEELKKYWQIE